MTHFAHTAYPSQHSAVVRVERAAQAVRTPIRRVLAGLQLWFKGQAVKRRQAAEDAKLWRLAQHDSRMMADLRRAMSSAAVVRELTTYY